MDCISESTMLDLDKALILDERFDVSEFLIAIMPIANAEVAMPDTCWTLLLSLLGVSAIAGKCMNEKESNLFGKMLTHPAIKVEISLLTNVDMYHDCKCHKISKCRLTLL